LKCRYCRKDAVYKCSACGQLLCAEHVRLRTVCPRPAKKTQLKYTIVRIHPEKEKATIRRFVKRFWGEQEQLTFDRKFTVALLPGYVAKLKGKVVGFISAADMDDAAIVVALGVLPRYQGSGIGKGLIKKVEGDAAGRGKKRLLVSTSNDDLPALAFYQSLGFQLYEVKPNVIAEKHGKTLPGIGNLPIRDELRLQKRL
jgi:ribosomal protein S18 acetylase RimI-like enzyme